MIRLAAPGLLLVLAGCLPEADGTDAGGDTGGRPPDTRPDPAQRTACEAEGGRYARGGLLGRYLCFRPTPDAGQSCRRAGDCSGLCLAETRSCSEITPLFGCHPILDDRGQTVTICID